jgi:predicted transcriptional regulator
VLEVLAHIPPKPVEVKNWVSQPDWKTKQISCQITALKNKGYVSSPARCKYEITEQGQSVLG